jgi:hypothetical protein
MNAFGEAAIGMAAFLAGLAMSNNDCSVGE